MGSDFFQNQSQNQQSCGLARYKSAPSSFLAALLDSTTDNSSSGDNESEALFSALMNGPLDLNQKNSSSSNNQMQYSMKQEVGVKTEPRPGQNGFSNGQIAGYENVGGRAIVGSYSLGLENQVHDVRLNNGSGNRNCSSLLRQSSSPAGFFNGFGVVGSEVGNYRVHSHAEASGLSNHMNFSSAVSSSSGFMPSIPENGNESIGTSPGNGRTRNGSSANVREYEAAFPHDSWNESLPFNNLKRNQDGDLKLFSDFTGLENQNGESRRNSGGLVHHLSLPKTSAEMAVVENLLQFQQDTVVPLQTRAKRGCATHPRSIAERMRRIRISEKMKKLQDLFPNMDKQTNTAEMLDLAVEYIKNLQKQVQTLTDTRAKCVCSSKPQQTTPTT